MPIDPLPDRVLTRRRAVGHRIRATRLDRNLSQEKLAELAGLDRQAVNRIEGGVSSPRLDSLLRIADALQVSLAALVVDV
ncbi:helix-turn-helix domain-containing protein [Streptomyces sp. NPDC053079]|uniref:helix-turn-helix domain-containing protein n=1 Tax=Streptomyces sp. NPDC053079 TaxID=3365697 RepID=UPI0037D8FE6E